MLGDKLGVEGKLLKLLNLTTSASVSSSHFPAFLCISVRLGVNLTVNGKPLRASLQGSW